MKGIPTCCKECIFFDLYDGPSEGEESPFCKKGMFFPTKQGTCKRQESNK